jgi:hypothetical protein
LSAIDEILGIHSVLEGRGLTRFIRLLFDILLQLIVRNNLDLWLCLLRVMTWLAVTRDGLAFSDPF